MAYPSGEVVPIEKHFYSIPSWIARTHLNTIFVAYRFGRPETSQTQFSQYCKFGACRGTWPTYVPTSGAQGLGPLKELFGNVG